MRTMSIDFNGTMMDIDVSDTFLDIVRHRFGLAESAEVEKHYVKLFFIEQMQNAISNAEKEVGQ
jgi:hypothetical protein